MLFKKANENLEGKVEIEQDFTVERVVEFLRDLDNILDRSIEIIAVGGTALELFGLKEKTKDIDFFIRGIDYETFSRTLELLPEKYKKAKIDYWENGNMILHKNGRIIEKKMPADYAKIARKINIHFNNITLKALDPLDIILTKTGRCKDKDIEDIKELFKAMDVKREDLEERFKIYIKDYNGSKERYVSNFKYIIDILFE